MKSFPKTATLISTLFFGALIATTVIAFSRQSHNTRMDMGKVHLLRSKIDMPIAEK